MTKTEQNRVLAWRLKVLREAGAAPRNVAQACRHFGLSRKSFGTTKKLPSSPRVGQYYFGANR
jgi:hypothetical protein